MKVVGHPKTTQKQKTDILQELRQIAEISTYRNYGIYDIDELMMQINLSIQPTEKALELIDGLLETRKDTHDLYQLVLRKVNLLLEQNEEQKANETLRTDPEALGGSSLTDFRALYSAMRAEDTTDVQHHVQAVREEWKSRGISFRENERIRLITVFFHDKPTEEESILFVGHVGVLLTADDGTLYFVEKVAFQEPYRLLRFADRTALSDYLMGKYDTSWGQDTASPFIMENDKLMNGWRTNPDGHIL